MSYGEIKLKSSSYDRLSHMKKNNQRFRALAPAMLRYGLALVVLWFSLQQFLYPSEWVAYIPDSVLNFTGTQATTVVFLNAIFEAVFGLLLLFGKYTRIAAFLLALHLFDIMWILGYGEIGVRDFGLGVALMSVAAYGPDIFAIEYQKNIVISSEILSQTTIEQKII